MTAFSDEPTVATSPAEPTVAPQRQDMQGALKEYFTEREWMTLTTSTSAQAPSTCPHEPRVGQVAAAELLDDRHWKRVATFMQLRDVRSLTCVDFNVALALNP